MNRIQLYQSEAIQHIQKGNIERSLIALSWLKGYLAAAREVAQESGGNLSDSGLEASGAIYVIHLEMSRYLAKLTA